MTKREKERREKNNQRERERIPSFDIDKKENLEKINHHVELTDRR